MRILLAVHNVYTDYTSGAARSVRTIVRWMSQRGGSCEVLCTARFDGGVSQPIQEHLQSLEIPLETSTYGTVVRFMDDEIPVTMLLTKRNDPQEPDRAEFEQFIRLLDESIASFKPDLLFTYGSHPVVQEAMRRARLLGVKTLFTIRNYGYEDPHFFEHVDHILTCSAYLSDYYHQAIGLKSVGIPSPIEWSEVIAPEEARAFLTFVNPSLRKGAAVFARLAQVLGERHPNIPILVVQSSTDAAGLNSIPGIDFSQYPQIMAAPAVQFPFEFFELTRALLVPSVFNEPFGRVAAEAMINGIPAIVSNRGALPQTVGGVGEILSIPDWLTETTPQIPSEQEIAHWIDAVCRLWDDSEYYAFVSQQSKQIGKDLYSEQVLKRQYEQFFNSLGG